MRINEYNKEVFFASGEFIEVRRDQIEFLKKKCLKNESKKARLCIHKDTNSAIQEMLIIHGKDTYVRPHKHINKIESFHVIEGLAKAVIFNEEGKVKKVSALGIYSSGRNFCWKFEGPYFHTLVIESDFFVFHEITSGPFNKSDTIFASWSPQENKEEITKFMHKIGSEANELLNLEGKIK